MATERVKLDWSVCPGGYRWATAKPAGGATEGQPGLVLLPATKQTGTWLPPPGPEPGLFRMFADLKPDQKEILAFANRWGDLDDEAPGGGTPLSVWRHQIADARHLLTLWDLLRAEDREQLASRLDRRGGGGDDLEVCFDGRPACGEGDPPGAGPDAGDPKAGRREKIKADDLVPLGWLYLQQDINLPLHHLAAEVPTGMAWDPDRQRPILQLEAPTLLAAVWLQFAEAVTYDRHFNRCRTCGRWFEVAPDLIRAHRRFCSNACRFKAYRNRQDRARQLFTVEKKTFEEIAQELDSDVATVKRWITGIKE
jgi:hypothetical protein